MNEPLFQGALEVINKLEQAGFEAYIVGGAVRDTLLHRTIGDMDIATNAYPEEVQSIFPKVIPTGIQHGTVTVRHQGISFEVTTFRVESDYSDYRRPDQVEFVSDLKLDLSRRDFTINALAMDAQLNIIDPFAGQQDIEQGIIRTVGRAEDRFHEDPLRMMRAIRFQSQLGFSIDPLTKTALQVNSRLIVNIAIERIAVEWEKTISSTYFHQAQASLTESDLLAYLPLFYQEQPLQDAFRQLRQPLPGWACFIGYMYIAHSEIAITDWIRDWKLSNKIKKDSTSLVQFVQMYDKEPIEWIVYLLPDHLHTDFLILLTELHPHNLTASVIAEYQEQFPIQSKRDLAVNGKDIQNFFAARKAGAWIQELLQQVEKAVVLKEIENDYDRIREWLFYDKK
ncbi:CCA tRNA nucleotidyltransferase [Gracilibacillus alcaliphilus]|uniref:CCA tRNA nucleotidyltransferase n=1 Tax=Gracilibacillus alcaliphilus TaxID=1401441 RepID=UPI0019585042|nr:CCA tRNA nucleotidyltransferase [Gracilibacillus alcaliphilus]MBM7675210.1 tRNA nucleotidyltransferase (CCA-adding enzyme) [Gracilibacillus alcaliphilus]